MKAFALNDSHCRCLKILGWPGFIITYVSKPKIIPNLKIMVIHMFALTLSLIFQKYSGVIILQFTNEHYECNTQKTMNKIFD